MTQVVACAEEEVLSACRRGEPQAWRELHRRFYPTASAFLRKLGVREADLEDCSQDVFLALLRYLDTFRGDAQFKTWLYRLCVTQARRARRRERMTRTLLQALPFIGKEQCLTQPSFSENRALLRVHEVLGQLPGPLRETFVLFEMEGMPGKAVAEILGCPEATVWRRLHEARKVFTRLVLSG